MTFLDLSESDIKLLSDVYNRDLTHEEKTNILSKEFDVASRTIRSWWQKLGITGGEPTVKPPPEVKEEEDLVTEEYEETPYDTLVLKSVWETQGKGGVTKVLRSWKNNTTGQDIKRFREELIEELASFAPTTFTFKRRGNKDGYLAIISFPDLHIGRTGVEEAANLYRQAIGRTLEKLEGRNITKILYVIGNDWLNVDTSSYTTTKGTPQKDVDDFSTTMRAGVKVALESIETLKTLEVEIDCIVLSGNHDRFRAEFLGIALSAYYRNDPQVSIDDEKAYRKYYTWGSIAMMFEHGELKINDYPQVFAAEQPKIWGNADWRYCYLGHLHHSHEKELRGVEVMHLPSLAPKSSWEDSKAYMSHQRGYIYLHSKEYGEEERIQIKV